MVAREASLSLVSTSEGERANLHDLCKATSLGTRFLNLGTLIVGLDNSLFEELCCASRDV